MKGLEFDYIFLVGCDDDMFPLPSMIRDLTGADLSRALITERSLLYVIASRAKRGLVVMHYKQPSLFLSAAIASLAEEDTPELENSA